MRKMIRRPLRRRINRPKECFFCKQKKDPDYKDIDGLKHFVTDRGKITSRLYNGICQRHQHQLAQAIKRARFLAFLPYIVRPS